MKLFSALFCLLFVTLVPLSTFAHSWGTSHMDEDNGYTMDIGYSAPAPEAGESVIFDFEILKDNERYRGFTDVWIRIEGENGTVLATGVHNAEFGGARLSYVFPGPGEYVVNVRYQKDDEAVASTEFSLTVVGDAGPVGGSGGGAFSSSNLIGIAIGLVLGFVVTSLIQGKRS